jgi:biotin transport system substrate-specific component
MEVFMGNLSNNSSTSASCANHKSKFNTYNIVLMAMFTAILCVSAYISITLPNGSHITFLNFICTLICLIFSPIEGILILLIWMMLGTIGVPVFVAGNAGISYLIGPYGGYYLAFIITAIISPLLLKLFGKIFKLFNHSGARAQLWTRINYTIVAVISVIVVDIVGMFWWKWQAGLTLKVAFVSGFLAFIVLDIVKAVVAAEIAPFVGALKKRYRG